MISPPPEITDKDVAEYQKLARKYFGEELDKKTAFEELSKLVRQMEIIYKPITRKEVEELC